MALFKFRREPQAAPATAPLEALLKGYSIEVMPRTAEKVASFRDLLPKERGSMSPISRARRWTTWWRPPAAWPPRAFR